MEHRDGALLDVLFSLSGHEQISDLRYEMTKAEVRDLINRVSFTAFSLRQWTYVISYISGKDIEITSEADLKKRLRSPDW